MLRGQLSTPDTTGLLLCDSIVQAISACLLVTTDVFQVVNCVSQSVHSKLIYYLEIRIFFIMFCACVTPGSEPLEEHNV